MFAVQAIEQSDFDDIATSLVARGLSCDDLNVLTDDIRKVYTSGEAVELAVSQRNTTNTRKWLLGVVVQTLAKEAEKDPRIIDDFFSLLTSLRGFNQD